VIGTLPMAIAALAFAVPPVLAAPLPLRAAASPAAVGQAARLPAASVVAEGGGERVTLDELRDAVRRARLSGDPEKLLDTMTLEGLEKMARAILEVKLVARRARAERVDQDPETARAIEDAVNGILARDYVRRAIAALDTSDAALRKYFDAHQADFRTFPRRRARHIVVATRAEADAALAAVRAGASFEQVARERNTDATRSTGGDLGWVPKGLMTGPFDQALFGAAAPGLAGPVQTALGFHVIRIDEIDPGQLPPFESVKAEVREAVVQAEARRVTAEVTGRASVTVRKDALGNLAGDSKR